MRAPSLSALALRTRAFSAASLLGDRQQPSGDCVDPGDLNGDRNGDLAGDARSATRPRRAPVDAFSSRSGVLGASISTAIRPLTGK